MNHPHLILLPGLHGTDDLWPPLLSAIPASVGRTVVVYPPDRCLSREQLLGVIEQAVRSVPDGTPLLLVGESFSGPLAVEFAARHPERVVAMALCATFILPPWPAWVCRTIAVLARYVMKPARFCLNHLPDWLPNAEALQLRRDALRHVVPAVLASRLRLVAQTDCRESLRTCQMPILYLRGKRDWVVGAKSMRQIVSIRPDAQVQILDCFHMILQRRPVEVWNAIHRVISMLPENNHGDGVENANQRDRQ